VIQMDGARRSAELGGNAACERWVADHVSVHLWIVLLLQLLQVSRMCRGSLIYISLYECTSNV